MRTGYPSASRNNTLYFSHRREERMGVYRSKFTNGEYQTPEFVATLFSQDYIHGDLFVAPDESYLIVSGRDPEGKIGFGNLLDLNILFKMPDGSWSPPLNVRPDINTRAGGENCPQVSTDGDGDVDIFVSNFFYGRKKIWFNTFRFPSCELR